LAVPPRRSVASFNPSLPEDHSLIVAGVLRDQFNGLKTLIDAVPVVQSATVEAVQTLPPSQPAAAEVTLVGQELRFTFALPQGYQGDAGATGATGEQGPQGPPFAQAVVDGVNTLAPGDPATVGVAFDGSNVHFSFGIPQGFSGANGDTGPQGPPFAQAVVDGVTTLPPGDPATVGVYFDGTYVHFSFGIPQGQQGPPGEVTTTQMDTAIGNAIGGTSANSNAVLPLNLIVSDPPTQSEVQTLANKVDELIAALRR
jgi:hypothetical protein